MSRKFRLQSSSNCMVYPETDRSYIIEHCISQTSSSNIHRQSLPKCITELLSIRAEDTWQLITINNHCLYARLYALSGKGPSFFLLKEKAQTEVLFSAVLLSVVNVIIAAILHTIFQISSNCFSFFLQANIPPANTDQSAGEFDTVVSLGVSVYKEIDVSFGGSFCK